MAQISITLNGETRDVPSESTIATLVDFLSLPEQRIAVEHNNKVVRRVDWPRTSVQTSDRIEVVHFVGGG